MQVGAAPVVLFCPLSRHLLFNLVNYIVILCKVVKPVYTNHMAKVSVTLIATILRLMGV